jgi:hypothetical protein
MRRAPILVVLVVVLSSACTEKRANPQRPTHLRVLVSANDGVRLVDLDSGSSQVLLEPSETNGDYWWFERVHGGVVAQGAAAGSGAGPLELNTWFVPNGLAPRVRLLGKATHILEEPAGGVWLVDIPRSDGGLGAGTVSLVSTGERTIRRGFVVCCQRAVAAVGNGRFVSETVDDAGRTTIHLYDSFSKRFVRRLSPPGIDALFHHTEARSVVWTDADCSDRCIQHVMDVDTGRDIERPPRNGIVSPDSAHIAKQVGIGDLQTIVVDGKSVADSESASDDIQWSPDSHWLVFVRPDRRHFGAWELGARSPQTIGTEFDRLFTWAIFDQSFSRS